MRVETMGRKDGQTEMVRFGDRNDCLIEDEKMMNIEMGDVISLESHMSDQVKEAPSAHVNDPLTVDSNEEEKTFLKMNKEWKIMRIVLKWIIALPQVTLIHWMGESH